VSSPAEKKKLHETFNQSQASKGKIPIVPQDASSILDTQKLQQHRKETSRKNVLNDPGETQGPLQRLRNTIPWTNKSLLVNNKDEDQLYCREAAGIMKAAGNNESCWL
jgi:hypothetical protein